MALNKRNIYLLLLFSLLHNFGFTQVKFKESGVATYYADYFQGRNTSSGEKYNRSLYTAAHPSLPFQTLVKITNLKNNKYVIVKINDRCPRYASRVIDLSRVAAEKIDMIAAGRAYISLEVITPADLNMISPEFAKPDSIIKIVIPDSTYGKSLNTGLTFTSSNIDEKLILVNHYSASLTKSPMLKPEEVGVLRTH